jgi:hypothetical protein
MRYAQIKTNQKLHLVYEAGEGIDDQHLIRAGHLSAPLCHTNHFEGFYRMTINFPLGNACKNCLKVYNHLYK